MNKNQKELYKIIDEILWNDWDPIGINDCAPRDEYQGYVPEIYSMILNNKSETEIANRLYIIETKTIGIAGNQEQCFKIAKILTKLQLT